MIKKAQSQIVTAVLLLLIVIVLSVLILNFSTNFVKDRLDETSCFDVAEKVKFVNSNKYTCYADTNRINPETNLPDPNRDNLYLRIHVGDIEEELGGLAFEIGNAASSTSVELMAGNIDGDGIRMYQNPSDAFPIQIPGSNEERTYNFDRNSPDPPNVIRVYPILKDGTICDSGDFLEEVVMCV